MARIEGENDQAESKMSRLLWPALVSLIVAVLASIITSVITTLMTPRVAERFDPGVAEPLRPSAYCVARDLGPFESDALVLAMEWRNTRSETVLVRQPYLILGPSGSRNTSPDVTPLSETKFVLVGTYPTLNTTDFAYPYDRRISFTLEPESISAEVFIFRPENYWSEEDLRATDFRFRSVEDWSVRVGHEYSERGELTGPERLEHRFDLDVYPAVDNIGEDSVAADCFDLDRDDG